MNEVFSPKKFTSTEVAEQLMSEGAQGKREARK